MRSVTLHGRKFVPYLSQGQIQTAVSILADFLNAGPQDSIPIFLVILNGAMIFAGDLLKQISFDCELATMEVSSYEGTASKDLVIKSGPSCDVAGRKVYIIEDIIDTGKTIEAVSAWLAQAGAKDIKVVALFAKGPEAAEKGARIGFEIEDKFIVGYGLDYDGLGRNLPMIYQLAD